jgi:hypothetical protein
MLLVLAAIANQVGGREPNFKNPAAVQSVANAPTGTASAAWWGFDPLDSTASIQAAINSGVPKVIVPYVGEEWIVGPITLASDQEIVFEPGVVVTAKQGAFTGLQDALFTGSGIRNVTLTGSGSVLRMRKADYTSPGYTASTQRHVLALYGVNNVQVRGLTLQSSGGDGIHIGPARNSSRTASEDVTVDDCVCNDNLRHGIGIVSGRRVVIDNCTVRNTSGASPEAGIAVEPADNQDVISDIEVRNCLAATNEGAGYLIDVSALGSASSTVDVRFSNSRTRNSGGNGVVATHGSGARPAGVVEFSNCAYEGTDAAGAMLSWNPNSPLKLKFENCKWRDASKRSSHSSLEIELLQAPAVSSDGLQFANSYVHDKRERSTAHFRTIEPLDERITAGVYRIKDPSDFLGGLRPRPTSDKIIRCIVNMNGYAVEYPTYMWAVVPLTTDLTVHMDPNIDEAERFAEVSQMGEEANPDIFIGRYISGSRVEVTHDRYPPPAVNATEIPEEWLKPDATNRVNISNPQAAEAFAKLIVTEFRRAPKPVVFLDNIVHPTSLSTWFPWADQCRFLQQVREGLHENGGLMIANVAMALWGLSDTDVALTAESVDGIALEQPVHPKVREEAARLNRVIHIYRTWLDAGKIIVLIPRTTEELVEKELQFIAAFAMAIREPGDSIFVAWPFWKPVPAWQSWPEEFGAPVGDLTVDNLTMVMERRFERGTLRLSVKSGTVLRTP